MSAAQRLLVCGCRWCEDEKALHDAMMEYLKGTNGFPVLIHGDAPGVDRCAAKVGRELGFEVEDYPADWKLYRRTAGHMRNAQMLSEGKPDLVLAFWDGNMRFDRQGKPHSWTADMIVRATQAGVPVRIVPIRRGE